MNTYDKIIELEIFNYIIKIITTIKINAVVISNITYNNNFVTIKIIDKNPYYFIHFIKYHINELTNNIKPLIYKYYPTSHTQIFVNIDNISINIYIPPQQIPRTIPQQIPQQIHRTIPQQIPIVISRVTPQLSSEIPQQIPREMPQIEIRFFTNVKYFEFSNFYPLHSTFMRSKKYDLVKMFKIIYKGREYKTSEHIYQAYKFIYPGMNNYNIKYVNHIMNSPTSGLAAKMGKLSIRGLNMYIGGPEISSIIKEYIPFVKIREDWDIVKYDIMYNIVKAKFTQHPYLLQLLKSTENSKLIEASPYDYYWGEGKNKTGLNKLGEILMKIRSEL